MINLEKIIAAAIKSADNSYFWEDYSKQAHSVIRSLNSAGFSVVPNDPSIDMVKAGVNAVIIGKTQPHELSKQIYSAMVKASSKK